MLKNENLKKLIICLMALSLLTLVIKTTLAADIDNIDDIESEIYNLPANNPDDIKQGNRPENIQEDPQGNLPENNPANMPENAPQENPPAGIGDNASIVFIIVFAVSAIYAYKKVRDYNI